MSCWQRSPRFALRAPWPNARRAWSSAETRPTHRTIARCRPKCPSTADPRRWRLQNFIRGSGFRSKRTVLAPDPSLVRASPVRVPDAAVSLANLGVDISVSLGGPGLDSPRLDNTASSLLLLACAIYIDHAARPVFAEPRWLRGGRAVLLALFAAALVFGYRFVIFLVTFYAT